MMVELLAVGLLAFIGALVAHEATHGAAAAVIPGVRITGVGVLPRAYVDCAIPEKHPRWVDAVIGLAPTIVGVTAGVITVVLLDWPPTTTTGLFVVGTWALYSAPSRGDITAAVDDTVDAATLTHVIRGLGILLVAWIVWTVGWGSPLQYIGQGIALAGTALLVAALVEADRQPAI